MLWLGFGLSIQTIAATVAAPTKDMSAASVVIRPECARIGGVVVNNAIEVRALIVPPIWYPHQKTTADPIRKKGRIPSLPSERMCS